MRVKEDQSRGKNICIDGVTESPRQNWKYAENKLHQILYNYLESHKKWLLKGHTELKSKINQNNNLV